MRLNAFKLSQPTVFACFLLFLTVMLEQAWCESPVTLYHKSTNRYLTVHSNGSVTATAHSITGHQCLIFSTTEKTDEHIKISIYNQLTRRYLCFTKNGRLLARKKYTKLCQFIEKPSDEPKGYVEYHSAINGRYLIAFNGNGLPRRLTPEKSRSNRMFISYKGQACKDINLKNFNETHHKTASITRHRKRHEKHNRRQRLG